MMGKGYWIGVDLGKRGFGAAMAEDGAAGQAWERLPFEAFENDAEGMQRFVAWAKRRAGDGGIAGICIESTGRLGWAWMKRLGKRLGPVSMVNPRRSRNFARSLNVRDKTDRVDACVLALYGVAIGPVPTVGPGPTRRRMQELVRAREALVVAIDSFKLRLKDGPECAEVREVFKQTIADLKRRLVALEETMHAVVEADEALAKDVARIASIPGVGVLTAYAVLAECGDLRQYSRNQLAAYVGVFPRRYESGSSVSKPPRMAKQGGALVRRMLYLCAMSARTCNPTMKVLYHHLTTENFKKPKAALGALMRKLLLLMRSLLVNETVYDAKHA